MSAGWVHNEKALADSIQAIINGEKYVRKCILRDHIFCVSKVNGDLKKYCGSGYRTKASKVRREDPLAILFKFSMKDQETFLLFSRIFL